MYCFMWEEEEEEEENVVEDIFVQTLTVQFPVVDENRFSWGIMTMYDEIDSLLLQDGGFFLLERNIKRLERDDQELTYTGWIDTI